MINASDFRNANKDNVLFARLPVYETPVEYRDNMELPMAVVTVAVDKPPVRDSDGDAYVRLSVLDVEQSILPSVYSRMPEFGDYLSRSVHEWEGSDVTVADDYQAKFVEPTKELTKKYDDFVKMHEASPYVARGVLYSETPTYPSWDDAKRFPQYERLEGTEVVHDLEGATLRDGRPVDSLDAAKQWMVENDYARMQGFSVSQHVAGDVDKAVPSGNFMVLAVPCPEYEGYKDYADRKRWAEGVAKSLGTEIGGPSAEEILNPQVTAQKTDKPAKNWEGRRLPNVPTEGHDGHDDEYQAD